MTVSDKLYDDVLSRIIPWIQENTPEKGVTVTPTTDIIAENLLDSMDLLRLVSFLEETFGVALDPDQLVPDNFDSPTKIATLVAQAHKPK
jgi:acyl carrier protein